MILSVDPGATSGYALHSGALIESGIVHPDSAKGLTRARELMALASVLVIEGMGYLPVGKARYDTAYGMGRHAGTWETLARLWACVEAAAHPPRVMVWELVDRALKARSLPALEAALGIEGGRNG